MFIMVLNDGETFTDLNGCFIAEIPDYVDTDKIEEYLEGSDKNDYLYLFSVKNEEPHMVKNAGKDSSLVFNVERP